MKLSMKILLSGVRQKFSVTAFQDLDKRFCYEGACIFHNGTSLQEGLVYIAEELPPTLDIPLPGHCAFIFTGSLPDCPAITGFDYMQLPPSGSVTDIANTVYEIFHLYWHWQEQMQQVLIDRLGLQQLFDVTLPMFVNPVFYVDHTWTIRAYAEYPELMDIVQLYTTTDIRSSYPYELKHSPQQVQSYKTTGPALWAEDEYTSFPELYCNIFLGETYTGRVFVDGRVRPFTEGDYDTLEIFCRYVKKAVDNRNYSPMSYHRIFEQYLVALLEGKDIDTSLLADELLRMGWETYRLFFCVLIHLEERDKASKSIVVTCNTIEASLIHCRAFPHKEYIAVLVPAELWDKKRHNFISQIAPIIRDGTFKAAVSGMFQDLLQIRLYYRQAEITLKEGLRSSSQQWIYWYEDFMLTHILQSAVSDLPAELISPPGLLRLQKYDQDNGTEYSKTLKIYLDSNCSPTETIRKMYLSRSTFLRRLDRIRGITGMDLDNTEVRLYLMIVFRL